MTSCRAIDDLLGKELNPAYCRAHHEDDDCRRRYPDAGGETCTSSASCMDPTGVCDVTTMACVQCIAPDQTSACIATTPVCGADHACRACARHSECLESNVCLPDGSCATADLVAYVEPGGAGTTCRRATPCGTLNDGIRTGRPVVKLAAGTILDSNLTSIDGEVLTIVAEPGARLVRSGTGVVLEVLNNSNVQIYDLEITGESGAAALAVSVPSGGSPSVALTRVTIDGYRGMGISATAGALTISRSTIRNNSAGGIWLLGGQFDITNSIIAGNGSTVLSGGIQAGGVLVSNIAAMPAGMHRLDFNTIVGNLGYPGLDAGIACTVVMAPLTFSNNIVYGNVFTGSGQQVSGDPSCATSYSDIGPAPPASGTGNIDLDPMFVDPAQGNFHLLPGSPARDTADPAAIVTEDFDGDARPQPADGRRDMGADEVRP